MAKNTGLFTPHLRPPASGTHPAAPLQHAAFVRPCVRSLRGQEQRGGASKRDLEIIVGLRGSFIKIHK